MELTSVGVHNCIIKKQNLKMYYTTVMVPYMYFQEMAFTMLENKFSHEQKNLFFSFNMEKVTVHIVEPYFL